MSINYESPFKMRDLLEPDIDKQDSLSYQSRYYAYAWLLTHYLQISTLRENQHLKRATTDFLLRYNRGESAGEAFENSFGMTPDDMDLALRKYTKQRRMTVLTVEVTDYEGEITQATLSPGEQNFLLADIAWRVGKEDVALDYLEDIDTEDRDFARSLSLAAVLENHQGRVEKASAYAEQALTLAPQDSQVLTNYAHWVLDTRIRLEKEQADVSALVDKQIAYCQQAIAIDPTNLEVLRYLWVGQIAGGDDVEALKTMMIAYQ